MREAIAVAEATGVHVQIAHLKLSGTDNWGGAAKLLAEIDAARQRGLPVDCDAYPYDTATNPLRNLLPRWVMEDGIPAMLERLGRRDVRDAPARRDRAARAHQLRPHPVVGRRARGHLAAPAARTPAARSATSRAAAASIRSTPSCDFIVADRGETRILITSMADADVHEITRAPWVMVGSDGNALATSGVTGQGKPHPRYYGTHARVLGALRARPRAC